MKIILEFDNKPNFPDFSESEFASIAKGCNGRHSSAIAEALSGVLGVLNAVSVPELVVRMVGLLNRAEQEAIATDILGQWGSDIIDSVGKTAISELTNKNHSRP